jgi:hypothetical protein
MKHESPENDKTIFSRASTRSQCQPLGPNCSKITKRSFFAADCPELTALPPWNQRCDLCLTFLAKQGGLRGMKWLSHLTIILVALTCSAQAQVQSPKPADWRTLEVPDFGTKIQYPAGIFSPAGKPEKGLGQRFERADGRAVLSIYSRPNEAGENPATYLRHNLRVSRSALDYVRITRSFFAISSEGDGVILYSRCNFSGGAHGAIHCFDIKYPQEEKRSWDAVVTRISLSLRPLEG